jgi:hypothetical protein
MAILEELLDAVGDVSDRFDFTNENRAEKFFTDRLRDVLNERSFTAIREVGYSGVRKKCVCSSKQVVLATTSS